MGVSHSSPLRLFVQLLFDKDSLEDVEVKMLRDAMSLFTCPAPTAEGDRQSLRTRQLELMVKGYIREGSYTFSAQVSNALVTFFLQKCPHSNLHVNMWREENEVRLYTSRCKPELLITQSFLDNMSNWYYGPYPDTALFSVREVLVEPPDVGHAVVIVLQKQRDGRVVTCYLDSNATPWRQGRLFASLVSQVFHVQVLDTTPEPTCILQSRYQSGNCKQWHLLFMICIICHPDLVNDMTTLTKTLERHAEVVILLFELYLFFVSSQVLENHKQVLERFFELEPDADRQLLPVLRLEGIEPCSALPRFRRLDFNSVYTTLLELLPWFQARNMFTFIVARK